MKIRLKDLREIAKSFDNRIANEMAVPSYLHSNPLIRWLMWKRLTVVQGLCKGLRVNNAVDFGTGIGVMLPFLSQISNRVIAFDKHIELATKLCQRYNLQNVDLYEVNNSSNPYRFPLLDESVDLILCLDVLEHIESLQEVTQELVRILKAGGILIVSGPSENLIYQLGRLVAGFRKKATYHYWNVDDVNQALAAHLTLTTRRLLFRFMRLFEISIFQKSPSHLEVTSSTT